MHARLSLAVVWKSIEGYVCFPESSFRKTTFQTFLCLFTIRKISQWKTLSGQRKIFFGQQKTLSSQMKIWLGFQESVFLLFLGEKHFLEVVKNLGCVCFPESGFQETTFQTFPCLFAIRKGGQRKTLSSQRKIWLGFQESVFLYFGRKTLSGSCEKIRNVILFANYIKFGPQTFDCYIYIYFVLNICFSISSL